MRSFIMFLTIGGAVGIVTVLVREAIAWLLPADLPFWYGVSVVLAYALGIVLSYLLQGSITFAKTAGDLSVRQFWLFAAVAVSGAMVALAVSLAVRYLLRLDWLVGDSAATAAFAIGALVAALFNFLFSRDCVFGDRNLRTGSRGRSSHRSG